jgi:Fungalysin metallopeptidase (M36)/Fungalysin/Thermolysin Propeptide Motif
MSRGLVGAGAEAHYDEQKRLVRVVGEFELPDGASAESVRAFLDDHAPELQLPHGSELREVHRAETETGTVVRLQQYVDDIPVFGSEIVVAADRSSRVRRLDTQNAVTNVAVASSPGDTKPLTAKQAYRRALQSLGEKVTVRGEAPDPVPVYYAAADGLRLAYCVLVPTRKPAHDWRLIVDARTGAILEQRDLIKYYDGQGLVFDPNPVASAHDTTLRDPDATAASCGFSGTARATIDAQRVSVVLRDITRGADGLYRLEGPYAKMLEIEDPATTFPAEADPNAFNYSSGDDRFECVQAYWTIDTLQRYLQSIGITTAHNSQIPVDPHDTEDGAAFFSSIDQALHFSASGACRPDRAEDAECIMHEYGHAIQNNQVPTWGGTNPGTGRDETGAMGEGFGDALACIFTASKHGGFGREVFEDWVFGDIGGLRRVDGTKVYPTDWSGEVHDDGEIWSAALWNIYRAIGGDSADPAVQESARRAVLKSVVLSHHQLAGNASMPDAAEAVMNENAALAEYRGAHLTAMLDSFHARGLLPCGAATDLYIRDVASDAGAQSTAGQPFWDSPDLWIRNADDNGTTHQPPEYGQDNWFYCRVTNRGTQTARAFVVTFNVKLWAGTEFVYPGDWQPPVSAACGFNLAPGGSRIVKALWPASMVPAPGSHACWIASVYTPVESASSGAHTWESNNLAQKNLTIVDLRPNDAVTVPFELGSLLRLEAANVTFEVQRPEKFTHVPVSIVSEQPEVLEQLFHSRKTQPDPAVVGPVTVGTRIRFPRTSEIEIAFGTTRSVLMTLGADSSVALDGNGSTAVATASAPVLTADLVRNQAGAGEIAFRPGLVSTFPVWLKEREPVRVGLQVQAPPDAAPGDSFDVDLVQRAADGNVVGGIRVKVNVIS